MQKNIMNTATNAVSQGQDALSSQQSKRQKIVAAVHLITAHLHVDEPFRKEARVCALGLCTSVTEKDYVRVVENLVSLLEVGILSGIVTEKNGSIIKQEVVKLRSLPSQTDSHDMNSFFGQDSSEIIGNKKTQFQSLPQTHSQRHFTHSFVDKKPHLSTTFSDQVHERKDITEVKKERKQKILDYINSKRTAVIKDIIALFPEVSEKTIQRELNVLLEEGKIEKRGDKRWSLYVAKSTLS